MRQLSRALVLLAGVFAFLVATVPQGAKAQEFVANQIENLINSETLTVDIQGLSGALTGDIRIESLTASDPQGVFLSASNLAMDWSPLSLVRSNVAIENLTAEQIVLERLPTGQPPADPNAESGGFSLPSITANIDNFAIEEFALGEAIAGTRARLSARASLALADDPVNLSVNADIQRLDQPGQIVLDVAFAPDDNRLALDIQASEPAGGLVATLLDIPDRPAVDLTINGSGPLSDFMANGGLTVGGEQAATLTARVNEIDTGRRVSAALQVAAERFVPEAYARYVAGGANLDLQAVLQNDGTTVIEQGELASEALAVTARGTVDPAGSANDLTVSLDSRSGGTVDLSFGEAPGQTNLSIASLQARLTGALNNAGLDVDAVLAAGGWGPYQGENVTLDAVSQGFDLMALRGPVQATASAEAFTAPDGLQDRFLTAPLRVEVDGALTENGLRFDTGTATTETARLSVAGTAALTFSVFDLTLDSTFQTGALSAALVPIAGEEVSVSGNVARTPDGTIAARDIAVNSSGLTVRGTAALSGDSVTADISGTLSEARNVNAALSGAANFQLTADGPIANPDVDLTLDGNQLSINGQELANLTIEARGNFVGDTPTGTVAIDGTLDGTPLEGRANLRTMPNGDREVADLLIRQGENRVTGELRLTESFAPLGTIRVAITDIGPLAALGGLAASGDVNGTITLDQSGDGTPIAAPDLTANALSVSGTTLNGAVIDLRVADYLGIPFATGAVTANAIDTGAVAVNNLQLDLTREDDFNALAATASVDGVPVELSALARFAPEETVLSLRRLEAAVEGAPVTLRDNATIRITNGTTELEGFDLAVGDGAITIDGSSGETLDITARIDALPAAVARPFAGAVDPSGTIDGTARVTGTPAAPNATFDLTARDLTTAQLRASDVPPIDLDAAGRYEDGVLTLGQTLAIFGEGSLRTTGSVGESFDLTVSLDALPVGLANGFVDGLNATGTVSGEARVTGPRDDPAADFSLTGSGITAPPIADAGIAPLSLDIAGDYASGTATIERAEVRTGEASLFASGAVGETLDLTARLDQFPVGIANGFVSDLQATGTLSGEAQVTGTPSEPQAEFDISGTGITTRQIARSGVAPLSLRLAGSFADGTADIETGVVNVGDGSLRASGRVGERLDIDLDVTRLPAGLANGFVDDLGAEGTISGTATASGTLSDPTASFDLTGTGLTTSAIAASNIDPLTLDLEGAYADGTLRLETAEIDVGTGSLTASGTIGEALDLDLRIDELPVGLANGFVDGLAAEGTISGTGTATGSLSDPNAEFALSGSGITTRQIAQSGIAPLSLNVAGSYADETATIAMADLDVGEGSLTASGTIGEALDLRVRLDQLPVGLANGFVDGLGAQGTISGNGSASGSLTDPVADFSLTGSGITTTQLESGNVPPLTLDVAGSYADGTARIATAELAVGTGRLTASGTVGEALDLDVSLDQLPVALANGFVDGLGARGTISGSASATGSVSDPQAQFSLTGSGITTAQLAGGNVPPLTLDVAGSYADGAATIANAELAVGTGSLTASGTVGERLDVTATLDALPVALANGFVDGLGARGTISGTAEASGPLTDPNVTVDLTGSGITTRQIAQSGVAPLSLDASGAYANGTGTIETANIRVGNGSLTASGTVGQALDLSVTANQLPVGLANGFVDGLGAQGTLSGSAEATGSLSNPNASFDLSAANVSVAQSRAAGAPALAATASGSYQGGTLQLAEAVVNVGGGTVTVTGSASPSNLALDARISNLPASIASAAAGGLAPTGTINGTVSANGSPTNPSVTYDINASGFSIQQTRDAGVGALAIDTSGQFANNVVTTDTSLSGNGLSFNANGSVNLAGGPTLDLAVAGSAPLSLANAILAEGGRSIQGTVNVDARVSGPVSQPSVNGTVSTAGARFIDAGANVAVNNITTTIALNGQTAVFQSFSAQLGAGGQLSVGGSIGLTPPFPADLQIRLVNGRYNDGEIVTAQLSADLAITGPLTGTPTISGRIDASEINVLVPENLPSSLARIDVTHVNAIPAVYEQQRELNPEKAQGSSGGGGVNLDIVFSAPNQVFVRGRGLDIELGGQIRITGNASSPQITGAFELQRGRFGILGRRLDFTEGTLTFTGNLVPTLDLLARSDAGDVTVFISVSGPADDPSFTFSSNPVLPQDEVLARLIFQQGTTDLSPLQIAQLAEAAASLAGVGGSTGLLENLRSQLGVDDLDIRTTADGQTAVGVGKYLNDNTYVGVDSTGRVSIDLKLGAGLKARGAVTATGGGEVGVFYEGEF